MQYIIITFFETLDHLKPESDKKDAQRAGEGDGRAELNWLLGIIICLHAAL